MAVSLKEVAGRAGLSQSTVSQILNRRPNDFSSEETRKRVFAIARELGYKQNFGYKVLRGDKTHTVAILVSQPRLLDEEHCQVLINKLILLSNKRGFVAYWNMLAKTVAINVETVKELLNRGVEHFIFIGEPFGLNEMVAEITAQNRNWITYGTFSGDNTGRNINSDSIAGTRMVLEYFLENGLADFKMLLPDTRNERARALNEAFPDKTPAALAEKYIFLYHNSIEWIDNIDLARFSAQTAYDATAQLMVEFPQTQAIFYLSDYFALGGVQWLFKHGYKTGKDIVVAGYNNIWAVREHVLPIISVEHDITKIANLLIENLEHREPVSVKVKTRLIVRKADY